MLLELVAERVEHRLQLVPLITQQRRETVGAGELAGFLGCVGAPGIVLDDHDGVLAFEQERVQRGADVELLLRLACTVEWVQLGVLLVGVARASREEQIRDRRGEARLIRDGVRVILLARDLEDGHSGTCAPYRSDRNAKTG